MRAPLRSPIAGWKDGDDLLCRTCAGNRVSNGTTSPDVLVRVSIQEARERCDEFANDECADCGECLVELYEQRVKAVD